MTAPGANRKWRLRPVKSAFGLESDSGDVATGERLAYHFTNEENGLVLHRYWTSACQGCPIKQSCTASKERRITRWDHEHVLEAVQRRLDEHPEKMSQRRPKAISEFRVQLASKGLLRSAAVVKAKPIAAFEQLSHAP